MTVDLNTDGRTISDALQKAGYDLVGGEPGLIQARLERGSQVVAIYIDGSGAVRAQITSGGNENEQRQQAGNMTYIIIQQGQLTVNLTTALQDASDINTLLPDIDRLASGRPIVSGLSQMSNPRPIPTNPTINRAIPAANSSSGRVSASDFTGGEDNSPSSGGEGGGWQHPTPSDSAANDQGGRVSASDFTGGETQPPASSSSSHSGGQHGGYSHPGNPSTNPPSDTTSGNQGGRVSASDFTEGGNSQ